MFGNRCNIKLAWVGPHLCVYCPCKGHTRSSGYLGYLTLGDFTFREPGTEEDDPAYQAWVAEQQRTEGVEP